MVSHLSTNWVINVSVGEPSSEYRGAEDSPLWHKDARPRQRLVSWRALCFGGMLLSPEATIRGRLLYFGARGVKVVEPRRITCVGVGGRLRLRRLPAC